jgi:hypothetical protein
MIIPPFSPKIMRLAVMLGAMVLSISFVILDILSVTATLKDARRWASIPSGSWPPSSSA